MSIKPTRNELLDMIIDRVQDEIQRVSQNWCAKYNKLENQIGKMIQERNEKRYNKQKAEEKLAAVQSEINAVLAKNGFSNAQTEISFTTSDNGLKITPVIKFPYAISGETVDAKPTKALDKQIDAKREELDRIKAESSRLKDKWGKTLTSQSRKDRYITGEEKRQLRADVVSLLVKSDPEMIKQIDLAAKAVVVENAEEMAAKLFR